MIRPAPFDTFTRQQSLQPTLRSHGHARIRSALLAVFVAALVAPSPGVALPPSPDPSPLPKSLRIALVEYCFDCHDSASAKGNFDLEKLASDPIPAHPDAWEKVIRKLQTRQMPPPGKKRPPERTYSDTLAPLTLALDRDAEKNPNPGPADAVRRLSRTEYQNAIRDLLDLEIDSAALLPKDDASHGFDHVGLANLSPTLLNRYIVAAEKISRLAVGAPRRTPGGDTYRTRPDLTQEEHVEGLPVGTRGGLLIRHTFPRTGEYQFQIRLTRDRNEHVEGMREPHELEILVDRQTVARFTVSPPKDNDHDKVDAHLNAQIPIVAGPHEIGVTFLKNPTSLPETKRQPYQARYNMHRHPRLGPAIYQVSINGPYHAIGPGDTPSRRRIFGDPPTTSSLQTPASADAILSKLLRRAYRRPITDDDLQKPIEFFRKTAATDGFEAGIEAALASILISPEFLFRIEKTPPHVPENSVFRIDDITLASRMSFFLWSSIPDDELLAVAERGALRKTRNLQKQTRRLLQDPKALNLVRNFADQWLQLRNLESITPDLRLFPDFDDNLRQAFRRETELHFEALLREGRSILDLLHCDYTFLNERLAKHYDLPHVYGSQFRRVALEPETVRGGLLRQGSILTVTSYATRTSPVLRGKWILENILGTPPAPPPPNVPTLREKTISESLPVRERLAQHRANAACASCHNLIDPPGFALENFDAIGRWRTLEEGAPVNASGGLPDGASLTGVAELEQGLLQRPELFATVFTERLLTFALGRGLEPSDAPTVRKIVRAASADKYRLSAIILGIVQSTPFTLRKAP